MRKKIILIAGMHRSGTSLVTRLLNIHGAYIPLETEYKDQYNEKGYWESFELQGLDDRILDLGDSSWSDIRPFNFALFNDRERGKFDEDVKAFVQKILSVKNDVVIIKDPRICRIIPIWESAFERQGAEVCALIPLRHPLQVAASINNRDGFDIEYGLRLWLRNVLEAEFSTRHMPRCFCTFDEALNKWPSCFARITRTLGFSSLRSYEEVKSDVSEFVEQSLAHWPLGNDQLELIEGADGPALRVFNLLKSLIAGENPMVLDELSTIHAQLDRNPSIDEILKSRESRRPRKGSRLETRLAKIERDQQRFLHHLDRNQEALEEKNRLLADALSELAQEREKTKQATIARSKLESELALAVEWRKKSEAKAHKLALDCAALRESLDQAQSATRHQLQAKEKTEAVLDYVRSNFSELIKRSESTEHQLRAEFHDLNRELSEKDFVIQEMEKEVSELHRGMIGLSDAYLDIKRSISWRLSWPFRFVVGVLIVAPVHVISSAIKTVARRLRSEPKTRDFSQRPNGSASSYHPPAESENEQTRPISQFLTPKPGAGESLPLVQAEIAGRKFVPLIEEEYQGDLPVNLIAFYLPQFHPIPENDKWWGEGFTEWTNVRPAKPKFLGHYQPRLPGELGYYDLTDIRVQQRQVELAKLYGIGGFCFYFYWFKGKRLLETPTLQYLENPELDLPFCLCWANENWTRAWDGQHEHVLIGQQHSSKDDLDFIEYLSRYFHDPRYIRVSGKPLLIVYRPSLLPEPRKTARRWRNWCRKNGVGEIFLAYTQSFEIVNPQEYGFDAALEFPPNNTGPDVVTSLVGTMDPDFQGFVYDWTSVANRSLRFAKPDFKTFRAVNPSWDNVARRPENGAIFVGTTPERYGDWLKRAIADTAFRFDDPSERLVFINAWNEWAEGAYLEPDQVYGYAYLDATRKALEQIGLPSAARESGGTEIRKYAKSRKILLVAHDGHPHGAQYLALHLARVFSSGLGFEVDLVVLGDGILIEQYRKWAIVHELSGVDPRGTKALALAIGLASQGHQFAICNTTVSGLFLETLTEAGIHCVSLVHELRNVIIDNQLEEHARTISRYADKIVFPADQVRASFSEIAPLELDKTIIRPQGLYKNNKYRKNRESARKLLRESLGLTARSRIVLGVGYLDYRKGIDLFVEAGLKVCERRSDCHFVWIGHWEVQMEQQIRERLARHELQNHFIFPGRQEDTDVFYAGSDLFTLTSREDPYPTTVMEALEVSVPVIGFSNAGGCENLIREGCGVLVPMEDVGELSGAIEHLLDNQAEADAIGEKGAQLVADRFSFRHYLFDLLEFARKPLKKVSAIVPNYNYARHLEQRLRSIFDQTYPLYEIIILDDCSTDQSIKVIDGMVSRTEYDTRVIVNHENSGSVFRQWLKGVEQARGDYVWICEADDSCEPEFLAEVVTQFHHQDVVLAYAQSKQIGENGETLAADYLDYTSDVSEDQWLNDYVRNGCEEIEKSLSIKNTIPNVSAVVFQRDTLADALQRCGRLIEKLKVAGDWLLYSEILRKGNIAFVAKSLNSHRRHGESVTISSKNNEVHMAEVLFLQRRIAKVDKPNDEARAKAKSFAEHVFHYLDLHDSEETEARLLPVSNHPRIHKILTDLENEDTESLSG